MSTTTACSIPAASFYTSGFFTIVHYTAVVPWIVALLYAGRRPLAHPPLGGAPGGQTGCLPPLFTTLLISKSLSGGVSPAHCIGGRWRY